MAIADGTRCPVCNTPVRGLGYTVGEVRTRSMTVHEDRTGAMAVPMGDIDLVACGTCGLVFNARFDAATQHDDLAYEETQEHSPTFRGYAADLARRLVEHHELGPGSRIVEIGCGKGGFLATLCAISGAEGVGIDPTADPGRVPDDLAGRVRLLADRYDDRHRALVAAADLVCCRHTLEHLIDPGEILAPLRRHLDDRREVPIYLDVPSGDHVIDDGGCWDIYYEHCLYYREAALLEVLHRFGFRADTPSREYDGQYLCVVARAGAGGRPAEGGPPMPDLARVASNRAAWSRWFAAATEGRVVLWGSGSRAVGFLGAVETLDRVVGVVDVNPHRHGRWMPGFPEAILSPAEVGDLAPEAVLVMNPAYEAEIGGMLDAVGVHARLLVVDRPPAPGS